MPLDYSNVAGQYQDTLWSGTKRTMGAPFKGAVGGALSGAALGGLAGGLPGAAIGASLGVIFAPLIKSSKALVTTWDNLNKSTKATIEIFREMNPTLTKLKVQWEQQERRDNKRWGNTLAPTLEKMTKAGIEFAERWNTVKIQLFKNFQPVMNLMIDITTGLSKVFLTLTESVTGLLMVIRAIMTPFETLKNLIQKLGEFLGWLDPVKKAKVSQLNDADWSANVPGRRPGQIASQQGSQGLPTWDQRSSMLGTDPNGKKGKGKGKGTKPFDGELSLVEEVIGGIVPIGKRENYIELKKTIKKFWEGREQKRDAPLPPAPTQSQLMPARDLPLSFEPYTAGSTFANTSAYAGSESSESTPGAIGERLDRGEGNMFGDIVKSSARKMTGFLGRIGEKLQTAGKKTQEEKDKEAEKEKGELGEAKAADATEPVAGLLQTENESQVHLHVLDSQKLLDILSDSVKDLRYALRRQQAEYEIVQYQLHVEGRF